MSGARASQIPIVQVKLVSDKMRLYSRKTMSGSKAAHATFKKAMKGVDREEFWLMALNNHNQPIHLERVSIGTLSLSLVHPREVFKSLILSNAHAAIVAHNHPSGDPEDVL